MASGRTIAKITLPIGLLVTLGLVFIIYLAWKRNQELNAIATNRCYLPVLNPDHTKDSLYFGPAQETRFLIRFDTECPSCWSQGLEIARHLHSFGESRIHFVSTDSWGQIINFREELGLNKRPNISFYRISDEVDLRHFGPGATPRIFIYGPGGDLLKIYKGQTKIAALLSVPKIRHVTQ